MKQFIKLSICCLLFCSTIGVSFSKENIQKFSLRRIELQNQYQNPQDVVRYYCERDASGFVWSGLLDIEIKEFTNWPKSLGHDAFYIAKDYNIQPVVYNPKDPNEALIKVIYNLLAIGNGNHARIPVDKNKKVIHYRLKKLGGKWKIISPSYTEIEPIVVESKFFSDFAAK